MKCDLKTVFIVSELVISDKDIEGCEYGIGKISVTAREGFVCDRCWKVVDSVNEDGLCERCAEILK